MDQNNDTPFPIRQLEGKVEIPTHVDRRYKQALVNEAWKLGNADVYAKMKTAVEKTPARNAFEESFLHFGENVYVLARMTAELVDELELRHPGLQRWLDISGHGNDKDMIEALVAWVTLTNPPAAVA